jgi:hypothetical protein
MCVCADDQHKASRIRVINYLKAHLYICISSRLHIRSLILRCIAITRIGAFTYYRHTCHFKQVIQVQQAAVYHIT